MARSQLESICTVKWPENRKRRTKERLFWFERISGLEPALTRDEIARRFGVNYQVVFKWTTFFGYKVKEESPGRRISAADWASADWSKGDLEIANGLGVSVPRVKARRKSNASHEDRDVTSTTASARLSRLTGIGSIA